MASISQKTSSVPGKQPLPADIQRGELAVNLADRKLYTKDHTDAIIALGGDGVLISDTPPATPMAGSIWWKSDTGELFVRYQDANSAQWVGLGGKPGKNGKDGTVIPSGATVPTTPAAGDLWVDTSAAANPVLKRYSGMAWVLVAPPAPPPVVAAATAPASPAVNALWFNTTNGKLLIYHDDGTSLQWVSLT